MIFFNWNPVIHKILQIIEWVKGHPFTFGCITGFICGVLYHVFN